MWAALPTVKKLFCVVTAVGKVFFIQSPTEIAASEFISRQANLSVVATVEHKGDLPSRAVIFEV